MTDRSHSAAVPEANGGWMVPATVTDWPSTYEGSATGATVNVSAGGCDGPMPTFHVAVGSAVAIWNTYPTVVEAGCVGSPLNSRSGERSWMHGSGTAGLAQSRTGTPSRKTCSVSS